MEHIITNIIVISVLVVIATAIMLYLIKAKKRGEKCIGCPYAKQCSGKCNSRKQNDN